MQPLRLQKIGNPLSKDSIYIAVRGQKEDPRIQKLLLALYPQQTIQWLDQPNFKEIDTYVLIYLCSYDVAEYPLVVEAIQRARQLIESQQLKAEAHVLLIVYRDLKVAFPERKLQREKVMSEMMTEEILQNESPLVKRCIRVTHEFGTHNLQDSLEQLTGPSLYFEFMS